MAVGFWFVGDRVARKAAREPNPPNKETIDNVTTDYLDPDIELRRIHAVRLEREPDERGQLMAAAFTENGRPVVLVLNTN
jgi:hypothetical protein